MLYIISCFRFSIFLQKEGVYVTYIMIYIGLHFLQFRRIHKWLQEKKKRIKHDFINKNFDSKTYEAKTNIQKCVIAGKIILWRMKINRKQNDH